MTACFLDFFELDAGRFSSSIFQMRGLLTLFVFCWLWLLLLLLLLLLFLLLRTPMHTIPLPGMHFFDAWRIRPSLQPDPQMGEKLASLGKEELIPQEPPNADYGQADRADIQHRREQEREAKGAAKTTAQLALEMPHVHRLAALVTEKADLLKELAIQRQSYQDEVKEASKEKAAARTAAPKKQKTTDASTPPVTPMSPPTPTSHGGQAMEVDAQGSTSQHSGAPFPYPFTHAPQYGGSTSSSTRPAPSSCHYTERTTAIRTFCDEILTVLANLPEEWPLVKFDLILNKAETYYVLWRRFLCLNERLSTLDDRPAACTINKNKDRILEHLVQVVSEWIVSSIEPAKELTRAKEPDFLFLHSKDFWFRSIWIDLHQALTIDRESSRDRANWPGTLHLQG